MARSFSKEEAERLSERAGELLKGLTDAASGIEESRELVTKAKNALLEKEVMEVLSGVPVDEINRDKRGFRVKTLRESGYQTVADLLKVPASKLSAIDGISDDSAFSIRYTAGLLEKEAKKKLKVSLSADDRSEESTALLTVLSTYLYRKSSGEAAEKLLFGYRRKIEDASRSLRKVKTGIRWFLSGKESRENAEESFRYLSDLLSGGFSEKAETAIRGYKGIGGITEESAREDFQKRPVSFINALEDLCPGAFGDDTTICGLPEDFAEAIREETVLTEGLRCELRSYQVLGVKYVLHQKRVLLGDEMGLGKTVQAIAVMVTLRNQGATHFAVVCPASVLTNWCREITKMSDLPVIKVHGDDKTKAFHAWLSEGGVAVTTYETAWLFNTEEYDFALLTVDEAHYIKNPDAQRTTFVKNMCGQAERLLFMTGTALENRVSEMINLIDILNPQIEREIRNMEYLSQAPEFRTLVAPVYYRRRREDVLTELPELIETEEWCELSDEETKRYNQAVLSKNYADVRRVSWNMDDPKKSSKAKRMLEIIEDAKEDGRKVIVFSFFLDTIAKVKSLLGDSCMTPINGAVPPVKRQEILDEFEKAPAGSVLCAQIQSGGTGLNIQTASVVILCEPQFKPSVENQAISRAYRMGQTRNVLVYRLLCEDTADEEIMNLLEEKQEVFDAFADSSAAADGTVEITNTTFGEIIEREIEKIQKRNETVDSP